MAGPVTQFAVDELWRVLDDVDPVDVLSGELCSTPLSAFPAEVSRAVRAAAFAVLAGRVMLVPGAVTVGVIGSGLAAELSVSVIARHLPDVVHVAVHKGHLGARVQDQLDLDGIDVAVPGEISDAVFGASFVVVTDALATGLPRRLAKGAVLVNTSGVDVPTQVDQVYAAADLRQVLAGTRPGRRRIDDVVLVEDRFDAVLADYSSARRKSG
ncbi:hypothetical protein [Actinocrispum wychmicini]|uniref:Ornithine cyclodeaminase/mu-crystallin family protein n=1 Tax=Actinocrispum wychmicini TaxID=1213861 RepID=A0A4V2S843_9PSEU|nr:hypothetical protein [Actinocrispum wychmicini]TCO62350.1 ornithine cyclodeaminase/mu-crystallin family protein [Actinocrispum wychmicini]